MAVPTQESPEPPYTVRAVDRVCDILDILANARHGASLSVVATAADLPKSSAFRYLAALERRNYVERDLETQDYRLGIAFRPQNTRAVEHMIDAATPLLGHLRDELEETTNLGILDATWIIHAVVAESPHIMRLAARPGERGFVHSTALGKAIAATLPPERVRTILAISGMPGFTESTVTDPDAYMSELEHVRSVGYGLDDAENQPSGRCVAVAIPGAPVPAGVSVSAPADRFPPDQIDDVVHRLRRLAEAISAELKH